MAYRLTLPPQLAKVHSTFHVSILRKYISDPSYMLDYMTMDLEVDLTFEVKPKRILDKKELVLRNKIIFLIKVLWQS